MIRSRLPKLEVPGVPFHEYFFKSTRKYADNLAMINNDTKEQFTFADLITKAKFIGRALVAMGVERGEILCTGARELADGYPILDDLQFVGDSSVSDDVMLPRIQPRHDIVYLPFSSGIHGKRKGILTTHYIMNAKTMISFNSNSYIHPERGEYTVAMMPFHRQLGLEAIFISLLAGATVVTVSNFCVHTLMTCIDRFK
ncbi:hypothetical protein TELCIR_16634, partial [Teladorsagia circumcincta]